MTLEKQREKARFLDRKLDEETAKKLEAWNLALLAVTLLHDADHIIQARRWKYHIPLQLWIINLAVYVMPTVTEFLVKNKRTSSFGALIVGMLTGLMPCGPLYALWLAAMGTGSARSGAVTMLAFALGTVPLMLLFGSLGSLIQKQGMKYMLKLSAVLVTAMGVKMLIRGLMLH